MPFVDIAVLWIAAIALATRSRNFDPREKLVIVWLSVAMVGSVAAGHLSWHYFYQGDAGRSRLQRHSASTLSR